MLFSGFVVVFGDERVGGCFVVLLMFSVLGLEMSLKYTLYLLLSK